MKYRYAKIRRSLNRSYFAPPPGSEERLLNSLGVTATGRDEPMTSERKFGRAFGAALAAAAVLLCVASVIQARPRSFDAYDIRAFIEVAESIDTSQIWKNIFQNLEE